MSRNRDAFQPSPPADCVQQEVKEVSLTKLQRPRRWRRSKNKWVPMQRRTSDRCGGAAEELTDNNYEVGKSPDPASAPTVGECQQTQAASAQLVVTTTAKVTTQRPAVAGIPATTARESTAGVPRAVDSGDAPGRPVLRSATESAVAADTITSMVLASRGDEAAAVDGTGRTFNTAAGGPVTASASAAPPAARVPSQRRTSAVTGDERKGPADAPRIAYAVGCLNSGQPECTHTQAECGEVVVEAEVFTEQTKAWTSSRSDASSETVSAVQNETATLTVRALTSPRWLVRKQQAKCANETAGTENVRERRENRPEANFLEVIQGQPQVATQEISVNHTQGYSCGGESPKHTEQKSAETRLQHSQDCPPSNEAGRDEKWKLQRTCTENASYSSRWVPGGHQQRVLIDECSSEKATLPTQQQDTGGSIRTKQLVQQHQRTEVKESEARHPTAISSRNPSNVLAGGRSCAEKYKTTPTTSDKSETKQDAAALQSFHAACIVEMVSCYPAACSAAYLATAPIDSRAPGPSTPGPPPGFLKKRLPGGLDRNAVAASYTAKTATAVTTRPSPLSAEKAAAALCCPDAVASGCTSPSLTSAAALDVEYAAGSDARSEEARIFQVNTTAAEAAIVIVEEKSFSVDARERSLPGSRTNSNSESSWLHSVERRQGVPNDAAFCVAEYLRTPADDSTPTVQKGTDCTRTKESSQLTQFDDGDNEILAMDEEVSILTEASSRHSESENDDKSVEDSGTRTDVPEGNTLRKTEAQATRNITDATETLATGLQPRNANGRSSKTLQTERAQPRRERQETEVEKRRQRLNSFRQSGSPKVGDEPAAGGRPTEKIEQAGITTSCLLDSPCSIVSTKAKSSMDDDACATPAAVTGHSPDGQVECFSSSEGYSIPDLVAATRQRLNKESGAAASPAPATATVRNTFNTAFLSCSGPGGLEDSQSATCLPPETLNLPVAMPLARRTPFEIEAFPSIEVSPAPKSVAETRAPFHESDSNAGLTSSITVRRSNTVPEHSAIVSVACAPVLRAAKAAAPRMFHSSVFHAENRPSHVGSMHEHAISKSAGKNKISPPCIEVSLAPCSNVSFRKNSLLHLNVHGCATPAGWKETPGPAAAAATVERQPCLKNNPPAASCCFQSLRDSYSGVSSACRVRRSKEQPSYSISQTAALSTASQEILFSLEGDGVRDGLELRKSSSVSHLRSRSETRNGKDSSKCSGNNGKNVSAKRSDATVRTLTSSNVTKHSSSSKHSRATSAGLNKETVPATLTEQRIRGRICRVEKRATLEQSRKPAGLAPRRGQKKKTLVLRKLKSQFRSNAKGALERGQRKAETANGHSVWGKEDWISNSSLCSSSGTTKRIYGGGSSCRSVGGNRDDGNFNPTSEASLNKVDTSIQWMHHSRIAETGDLSLAEGTPSAEAQETGRASDTIVSQCESAAGALEMARAKERSRTGKRSEEPLLSQECEERTREPLASCEGRQPGRALSWYGGQLQETTNLRKQSSSAPKSRPIDKSAAYLTKTESLRDNQRLYVDRAGRNCPVESRKLRWVNRAVGGSGKMLQQQRKRDELQGFRETLLFTTDCGGELGSLCMAEWNESAARKRAAQVAQLSQFHFRSRRECLQPTGESKDKKATKQGKGMRESCFEDDLVRLTPSSDRYKSDRTCSSEADTRQNWSAAPSGAADTVVDGLVRERPSVAGRGTAEQAVPHAAGAKRGGTTKCNHGNASPGSTTRHRRVENEEGARFSGPVEDHHVLLGKIRVRERGKKMVKAEDGSSSSIGYKLTAGPTSAPSAQKNYKTLARTPRVRTIDPPGNAVARKSRELPPGSTRHLLPGDFVVVADEPFGRCRSVGFSEGSVKIPAEVSSAVPGWIHQWRELAMEEASHCPPLGRCTPTRHNRRDRGIHSNSAALHSAEDRDKAGFTVSLAECRAPCTPLTASCPFDAGRAYEHESSSTSPVNRPPYPRDSSSVSNRNKPGVCHVHLNGMDGTHIRKSLLDNIRVRNTASVGGDNTGEVARVAQGPGLVSGGSVYENKEVTPRKASTSRTKVRVNSPGEYAPTMLDTAASLQSSNRTSETERLKGPPPITRRSSSTSWTTVSTILSDLPTQEDTQRKTARVDMAQENIFSRIPASSSEYDLLAGDEDSTDKETVRQDADGQFEAARRCGNLGQKYAQKTQFSDSKKNLPVYTGNPSSECSVERPAFVEQHQSVEVDGRKTLSLPAADQPMQRRPRAKGGRADEKISLQEAGREGAKATLHGEYVLIRKRHSTLFERGDVSAGAVLQGKEVAGEAARNGDVPLTCTQPPNLRAAHFLRRLLKVVTLKQKRRKKAEAATITEEERNSCDVDEEVEGNELAVEGSDGKKPGATVLQQQRQGHLTAVAQVEQTIHLRRRFPSLAEGRDFSRSLRGVTTFALISAQPSAGDGCDAHISNAGSHGSPSSCSGCFSATLPSPSSVPPVPFISGYLSAGASATIVPRPSPPSTAADTSFRPESASAPAPTCFIPGAAVSRPAAFPSDSHATSHHVARALCRVPSAISRSGRSPFLLLKNPMECHIPSWEASCVEKVGNRTDSGSNCRRSSERTTKPPNDGSLTPSPGRSQISAERRQSEAYVSNDLSFDSQQLRQRRSSSSNRGDENITSLGNSHGSLRTASVAAAAGEKDGSPIRQRDYRWEKKVHAKSQVDSTLFRKGDGAVTRQLQSGRHHKMTRTKLPIQATVDTGVSVVPVRKATSKKGQHEVLRSTKRADASAGTRGCLIDSEIDPHEGRRKGSLRRKPNSGDRRKCECFNRAVVDAGTSREDELHRQWKGAARRSARGGTERLVVKDAGSQAPSLEMYISTNSENSSYSDEAVVLCRSKKNIKQHRRTKPAALYADSQAGEALCKPGSLRVFQELLKGSRLKIEWDAQSSAQDSADSIPRQEVRQGAAVKSRDQNKGVIMRGSDRSSKSGRTTTDTFNDKQKSDGEADELSLRLREWTDRYTPETEKRKSTTRQKKHVKRTTGNLSSGKSSLYSKKDNPGALGFEHYRKTGFSGSDKSKAGTSLERIQLQNSCTDSEEATTRGEKSATNSRCSSEESGGASESPETEEGPRLSLEQTDDIKSISRLIDGRRRGEETDGAHSSGSIASDIAQLRRLRGQKTMQGARTRQERNGAQGPHKIYTLGEELGKDEQNKKTWLYGGEAAWRALECWSTSEAKRWRDLRIREQSCKAYKRWFGEGLHSARKVDVAEATQKTRESACDIEKGRKSIEGPRKGEEVVRRERQQCRSIERKTESPRQHHERLETSVKSPSPYEDWTKVSSYMRCYRKEQYDTILTIGSEQGPRETAKKQADRRERSATTMPEDGTFRRNSSCSAASRKAHKKSKGQQLSSRDHIKRVRPGPPSETEHPRECRTRRRAENIQENRQRRRSQYHGRCGEKHSNKETEESVPRSLRAGGITYSGQFSFMGKASVPRCAGGDSDADEDLPPAPQLHRPEDEKPWNAVQTLLSAERQWRKQPFAEKSNLIRIQSRRTTESSDNGSRGISTVSEDPQAKEFPVHARRQNRHTNQERNGVKLTPAQQNYGKERNAPAALLPNSERVYVGGGASESEEAELGPEEPLFVEDQRQQALLTPGSRNHFPPSREEGSEEECRIREEEDIRQDQAEEEERDCSFAETGTGKWKHPAGDLRILWTGVGKYPRAGNRSVSPSAKKVETRCTVRQRPRTPEPDLVSANFVSQSWNKTAPLRVHSRRKLERRTTKFGPLSTVDFFTGKCIKEAVASGEQQRGIFKGNGTAKGQRDVRVCLDEKGQRLSEGLHETCCEIRGHLSGGARTLWRRRITQQDTDEQGRGGASGPLGHVGGNDGKASEQRRLSDLKSTQDGAQGRPSPRAINDCVDVLEGFQAGRCAQSGWEAALHNVHREALRSTGEPTPTASTVSATNAHQETDPSPPIQCLRDVRRHTRAPPTADSQSAHNRITVSRRPNFKRGEADGERGSNGEMEPRAHSFAQQGKQEHHGRTRSHSLTSSSSTLSNERIPEKGLDEREQPANAPWFRAVESLRSSPLLSSYDFVGEKGTAEVLRGSLPGPNSASLSSSNWHDRLQWSACQVFAAAKGSTEQQKTWGDKELLLCKEIGHFTAAARTAAVALAALYPRGGPSSSRRGSCTPSPLYLHRDTFTSGENGGVCRPVASQRNELRVRTASAFVEVTPETFPTIWKIYKPKFDEDSLFLFDSLVLTMVRGSRRHKVSAREAGKIYAHDFKGRKAACTAIYKMHLTADISRRGTAEQPLPKAMQLCNSAEIQENTPFTRMDLALPFAAFVEYRGQRILVEPLMPISPPPVDVLHELMALLREALPYYVQQCSECGGSTLTALSKVDKVDKDVSDKLKYLAKVLRLIDCPFPFGLSDFSKTLALPAVQLWRSRVDQLCVLRNLQELLPPLVVKGCVQPTRRFREVFVRHVSDTPLPCTSLQPCEALSGEKGRPARRHRSRPLNALELLESASQNLMQQAAADLLSGVEAMTVNFLDSADLSITLHEQGLNTRLLGLLYSKKPGFVFQDAMLRDMLARATKRLFLRRLEELHREANDDESWDQLSERAAVTIFNLVFDKTEDSRMFWTEQLLPEVADMFDVEIPNVSLSDISVESLFKAMEFHLGVKFSGDVFEVADSPRKDIRSGRLRLPLTTAHLASFVHSRDALLFPHFLFIRQALQDECHSTGEPTGANPPRGETWAHRETSIAAEEHYRIEGVRPATEFELLGSDSNNRRRLEGTAPFSRYLRGFYPKTKVILPDLAVLETAREQARTFMHMSVFPLEACYSHTCAGLVSSRLRPMAFGTANTVSAGLGGAIRATVLGVGYPCHPHCMRKSELVRVGSTEASSAYLLGGDEEQNQLAVFGIPSSKCLVEERCLGERDSSSEVCLTFQGCRVALLVLLTVYCMIAHDVVVVAKILQQLAYVLLQHGLHSSAAAIAKYIVTRFPDVVFLQSEGQLSAFQCAMKSKTFDRILAAHGRLLPLFRSLEGNFSLRAMLVELLVAAAAFQHEQWSEVVYHGAKVYKCTHPNFSSKGCNWTKIAALRLVGKSLAALGRTSEGVDVLKEAVRDGADDVLPTYVTCMSRYWLAVALLKTNRFQEAKRQVTEALEGLESVLGPHHPITLSSLFLLARVQQTYGCEQLAMPPVEPKTEESNAGDCDDAEEQTWRVLTVEDLAVIEEVYGDQRRALSRKKALEAYGTLFGRLLVTGKYACVIEHQNHIQDSRLQKQQLLRTVQETLTIKMCNLPTPTLRLLAYRLHLLCVCQSGSKSLQRLALMQSSPLPHSLCRPTRPSTLEADEKTTLTASGFRTAAATAPLKGGESLYRRVAERKRCCGGEAANSLPLNTRPLFRGSTPSYGSHRHRATDVLQAEVIPRPDNIPERQHSVAMMKLLLVRKSPQLVLEVLRSCCTACEEEKDLLPAEWFDRVISSLLEERGAVTVLHNFVVMAANFFTPIQKNIFLSFLHGVESAEVENALTENMASDHAFYGDGLSYQEPSKYDDR